MGRAGTVLARAALVLFGLVVAALVGEGIARVVGAGAPAELGPTFDRSAALYRPHPERFHRPRKKRDRYLVVAVGDSFTVGQNVQWDDAYPARLERLMNLNPGVMPAEVHAFAKNGTATADQEGFVRKALRLRPNLLLLGIFINDTEDHKSGSLPTLRDGIMPRIPDGRKRALLERSYALSWLYNKSEQVRAWRATIAYYENLYDPEYSGWIRFREALAKYRRLADNRGVPLAAAIFPAMVALEGSDYPFGFAHERLSTALEQASIPHLDLLDGFLGKSDMRMAAYPGIDGHPSEIGHRVAAEAIFEFLLDRGLIDPAYRPQIAFPQPEAASLRGARWVRTPAALGD